MKKYTFSLKLYTVVFSKMRIALLTGIIFFTFSSVYSQTKDLPTPASKLLTRTLNSNSNQFDKNAVRHFRPIPGENDHKIQLSEKKSTMISAKQEKCATEINTPKWQKGGIFEGLSPDQEILEKRTRTSKHFQNADGTATAFIGGLMHYKDEYGTWQDIDFSIKENSISNNSFYKFCNLANEIKSFFPRNGGQQGVLMQLDENFRFSWWDHPILKITQNGNELQSITAAPSEGILKNGSVIYPEVYEGITDQFIVVEGGMENNTIINHLTPLISNLPADANLEFTQFIPTSEGWVVENNGKVLYRDFECETFHIRIPGFADGLSFKPIVIYDNTLTKSEAVRLLSAPAEKLTKEQKNILDGHVLTVKYKIHITSGGIQLAVVLPASWLQAANRNFPVIIDPEVYVDPTPYVGSLAPLNIYFNYSRTQAIYLQSELNFLGNITQIAFYAADEEADADVLNNSQFWMTTTTNSIFSSATWQTPGTSVYGLSNLNITAGTGWKPIALSTTFSYTNANNLMISYRHYDGSWEETYNYYVSSTLTANRCLTGGDDAANPPAVALSLDRPIIRITYNCVTAPSAFDLTNPAADTIAQPGKTITFKWANVGDADSYDLYIDGNLVNNYPPNTNVFLTFLEQGSTISWCGPHTWYVKAKNNCGEKQSTSTRTFYIYPKFPGSTATVLNPTTNCQTITGFIKSGGANYYSFTATAGNAYYFGTANNAGDGLACGTTTSWDTYLRIYHADGSCSSSIEDDEGSIETTYGCSRIGWTCDTTGTYYVQVVGYDANVDSGTYYLQYKYKACSSPCPATTMSLGTVYPGTVSTTCSDWDTYSGCSWVEAGDETVYSFTPASTGNYSFTGTPTSGLGDPDFFLMSTCGNTGSNIYNNCWDEGGITLTLTAGTTYYLIVDNWSTTYDANYSVSVAECPSPPSNDFCSSATVAGLTPGVTQTFTGNTTCAAVDPNFGGSNPEVWISFNLPVCMDVTIEMCGNTPVHDNAYITLFTDCSFSTYYLDTNANVTECVDGGVTIHYYDLPAGTYYYPVLIEPGWTNYTVDVTGVTVITPPTSVLATPAIINSGQSSTLSATAGGGSDQIQWYTGGCGTILAGTGTSISVAPASTTTYYVRIYNSTSGCYSSCDSVKVTVIQPPGHAITGKTFYTGRANAGNPVPNMPTYNPVLYAIDKEIVILKNYPANDEVARDTSDALGFYQFSNVADGNYLLSYDKYTVDTMQWGNDVNAIDVSLMKYFIGSDTIIDPSRCFASKYKRAANVDNNLFLNAIDVARLKAKVGSPYDVTKNFPKGNWVALDQSITVAGSDLNINLETICFGDYNASSSKYRDSATNWAGAKALLFDIITTSGEYITTSDPSYFEIPLRISSKMDEFSAMGLELSYPEEYMLVKAFMPKATTNKGTFKINPTLEEIIAEDNDLLVTDKDGVIRILFATTNHFDIAANEELIILGFHSLKNTDQGALEFKLSGTGVIGNKYGEENDGAYFLMPRIYVQGSSDDAGFEFAGYPNPFMGEVTINYTIPENGSVRLTVYNAIGALVSELVNENQERGKHSVLFLQKNLPSGMYTFKLEYADLNKSKCLILKMIH